MTVFNPIPMKPRGLVLLPLLIIIAALAILGATSYLLVTHQSDSKLATNNQNNRACTEEAKICPDGSAVGRLPPNCEFKACPDGNGNVNVTINANTIIDSQAGNLSDEEEQDLKAAVYSEVHRKTKGIWEKRLGIDKIDLSNRAVIGNWWTKDEWTWIAWRQNDKWNILVSLDGFDCAALERIPSEYASFFHDTIYNMWEYPYDKLYCYSHLDNGIPD